MAFHRDQKAAGTRGYLRHVGATALAVALVVALAGEAAAKSPKRAKWTAAAPAPSAHSRASEVPSPGSALLRGRAETERAPARFFTINEVLAKHNAGRTGAPGRVAAVGRPDTATDASPAVSRAPGPEPFGLFGFRAPDGLLWKKWRGLAADLASEADRVANCRAAGNDCSAAAARFAAIVEEAGAHTGRARLETANRLLNDAIRYVNDLEQHGVADRWSAPLASLAAGRGDCEDYAIAKYAALRAAGVPEADMRIVLVRDTSIRLDHAVLAVREKGRWLVLDNRRALIAEDGDLRQYLPLFAVGSEGVKLFAAPYAMWGEDDGGDPEFADWTLRDVEFADWTLRGSDAEPAAAPEF